MNDQQQQQTSVVRLIEENCERSNVAKGEEEEDIEPMLLYESEPEPAEAGVIEGTTWQYRLNRWWYHPAYDPVLPRCLATSPRRWAMALLALIAIIAVTIALIVHM